MVRRTKRHGRKQHKHRGRGRHLRSRRRPASLSRKRTRSKRKYNKRPMPLAGGSRMDYVPADQTYFGINGIGQMMTNGYRGVMDQLHNFGDAFTGAPYITQANAVYDQYIPLTY